MRKLLLAILIMTATLGFSQAWSGILYPTYGAGACSIAPSGTPNQCAIDWTQAGVGGIPARTTICSTVAATACGSNCNSVIQSALNNCPSGQTVLLSAGTFPISSSLSIPSNVTLRGAGAGNTILNAQGSSSGVINLGSGNPNPSGAVSITAGATAGSTSITVSSNTGISVGSYLLITELNNSSYVTIAGGEGNCTWCDEYWNGTRARGQIVEVQSVSGTTIGISPRLYSAYTLTPQAVPFTASAKYAGVENLQVYANNTGYTANFQMQECAYCWIKGVEGNYADGDHVQVHWGFRDEIRDSYFSNAYHHTPGTTDSDVFIVDKTSATLVENNIMDRLHYSIILNWGAAGNVIAYNYMDGNFDSGSTNAQMASINTHGAHPQFNLLEGNVGAQVYDDGVWGSSSHNTLFRNWIRGTNYVCNPMTGRGTVNCSSGHWAYQAVRAMQISFASTYYNFVGNVVGSAQMAALQSNGNGATMPQAPQLAWPSTRAYDSTAYGWTFGYSELSDAGSLPEDNTNPYTTAFQHGNYNNVDSSLPWSGSITHTLPASFYLLGKPSWWGTLSYPAVGPDITGGSYVGGHANVIPAQNCYLGAMAGSDGGAASPLSFDASRCYASGAGIVTLGTSYSGTGTVSNCGGNYTSGSAYSCLLSWSFLADPPVVSGCGGTTGLPNCSLAGGCSESYSGTISTNCAVSATFSATSTAGLVPRGVFRGFLR